MRIGTLLAAVVLLTAATTTLGQTPSLEWSYDADSNLYASPVVADLHPSPGLETVVSDSEVHVLRCIGADGSQIWQFDGDWKKRLTSTASVSFDARAGRGTVVVAGSDGHLCCVDGETGDLLWDASPGAVTWGAATWADLGRGPEVVVGTEHDGIHVFGADGTPVWRADRLGDDAFSIVCPLATADVDGDGAAEVYAVDAWGPFCADGSGTVRWFTRTGDTFVGAPVIADLDGDGAAELVCTSSDNHAIHCFDARDGSRKWSFPTVGEADAYPGSSIAVGDIDGDGFQEVVAPDKTGYVYCLRHDGSEVWRFATQKRARAGVSLGDIDGDGAVEVLVVSGDHFLYCVGWRGDLEWRFETGLRLVHPATIADVDVDGKTEFLMCGSDRTLRCLTMDAPYAPERMPWPSRRYDLAQSGSNLGRHVAVRSEVEETRSLLDSGGFEVDRGIGKAEDYATGVFAALERLPAGWTLESDASVSLVSDDPHGGAKALRVAKGLDLATVASRPVEVSMGLRHVSARVWVKNGWHGAAQVGAAKIRWTGANGILREDALGASTRGAGGAVAPGGWVALTRERQTAPQGARWLQLVLVRHPVASNVANDVCFDDVDLVGQFESEPEVRVFVNQVGYDLNAPKGFVVSSNFPAESARFEVVDEQAGVVHAGSLRTPERITGAYGHDWGAFFWRGDFSALDQGGRYRIRVTVGDTIAVSWPFGVSEQHVWKETVRPAYRFFYYQRCGMAIPGFHGACHLDDAVGADGTQYELWGGWHDAGDYNTYHNAPYTFGLARACAMHKSLFDVEDLDGDGVGDFVDEVLWGGDHSRRMVSPDGSAYGGITSGYGFWGPPELETDNEPSTGDERGFDHAPDAGRGPHWHVQAMARIARMTEEKAPYVEAARRAFVWREAKNARDAHQLNAALDLYAVTDEEAYATAARETFAALGGGEGLKAFAPHGSEFSYYVDAVEAYDSAFGEDHSEDLRRVLVETADGMIELARNPFGVYTHGPKERPNFFNTPAEDTGWHVGTSSFITNAAGAMAIAYRYQPNPEYLEFVYDQLNWSLGVNPLGLCLIEGLGSVNPPSYHHRYIFSGVARGAVPGSLVNGVAYRKAGDDRPFVDMRGLDIPAFEPNEAWLPHNTAYLNTLANLRRIGE
ncbi:MAG: PQQ-binding-like beta-propeller repeat protein [bacterium]|nr:PQQ-binding-like beta-propeller repeat protein [bacterium]